LLNLNVAAGGLHEHEGIVEANADGGVAWLLQQQQHWMARQLFDAMPPCVVCERRLAVTGSAVGSGVDASAGSASVDSRGVDDGSKEGVSAAAGTSGACTADAAAAAADAAVDVQLEGSSGATTGSTGEYNHTGIEKQIAAGEMSSSSSSVGVSKGGWHRVDVWTGHVHAHATIIVRDKRYESQSRDLFAYLVNHMSL
jgi:hypothetical protein